MKWRPTTKPNTRTMYKKTCLSSRVSISFSSCYDERPKISWPPGCNLAVSYNGSKGRIWREGARNKEQMKEKRKLWLGKRTKKDRKSTRHRHKQLEMTGHFFLITDIYHECVSMADVRSIFFCSRDVTKTPGSSLLLQLPISRTGLSFPLYDSAQDIVHTSPHSFSS
jgi:hypothetical protein